MAADLQICAYSRPSLQSLLQANCNLPLITFIIQVAEQGFALQAEPNNVGQLIWYLKANC